MKILLIGSKKSPESQQLKKEAEKRSHYLKIIPLNQLILSFRQNLFVFTKEGRDISEFDAILFRAINRHIVEAKIIAEYMKNRNKIVIDDILAGSNYDHHKFLMHTKLKEENIPQPITYLPLGLNALKKTLEKIEPPLVVKHLKEMRGRYVFRFDAQKEVLDFFSRNKKEWLGLPRGKAGRYLIQEWYPAKKYYRVLILGEEALGAMERLSLLCKNRPKIPLAERSKKIKLTKKLKELALTAARTAGIEFAGVDIMPDKNGQLRVLEINRSPQFKRFSQITGLNVAKKVIKYIESKPP